MKLHKNQSGFSHIEIFLVVIVVVLIGAVGWMVYDRQSDKNDSSATATKQISNFDECAAAGNPIMETYPEQCAANGKTYTKDISKNKASGPPTVDGTAEWQAYTSRSGRYSVKYPKTWVVAANLEYCTDGLTLIGVTIDASQKSVGKCGSDGAGAFGQMAISEIIDGSDTSACSLDSQQWKTDSKKSATVAGLSATITAGTYIANEEEFGGYEKGTSTVKYCFAAKGTAYIASYIKREMYPDVLNDFDTMVTKTLTIN